MNDSIVSPAEPFGIQFGRQLSPDEFTEIEQPIRDMYDGGVKYTDHLVGAASNWVYERIAFDCPSDLRLLPAGGGPDAAGRPKHQHPLAGLELAPMEQTHVGRLERAVEDSGVGGVEGDEALVYDTHMSIPHARIVRQTLEQQGVRHMRVILSHWHTDHVAGNEVFAEVAVPEVAGVKVDSFGIHPVLVDVALMPELNRAETQEAAKAAKSPAVAERFAAEDAEAVGSGPAEYAAFIKKEQARWGKVVKAAGVKAD